MITSPTDTLLTLAQMTEPSSEMRTFAHEHVQLRAVVEVDQPDLANSRLFKVC